MFQIFTCKNCNHGPHRFFGSEEKVTNHRAVSDMMGVCVYVMRIKIGCRHYLTDLFSNSHDLNDWNWLIYL